MTCRTMIDDALTKEVPLLPRPLLLFILLMLLCEQLMFFQRKLHRPSSSPNASISVHGSALGTFPCHYRDMDSALEFGFLSLLGSLPFDVAT